MVVGNLGLGPGDHAEQGGLAHVGEAHQPHVRQQLQLQQHLPDLPRQARLGEPGALAGGGGEVLVAPAAVAPPGQHEVLPAGHIADDLLCLQIPHHRAPGYAYDQITAVLAGAPLALALPAVFGGVFPLVAEVHQGGHMGVHPQNNVPAPAAVPAVGTAGGHVFLPVEGHGPAAAVPGPDGDPGGVDKLIVGHVALLLCVDQPQIPAKKRRTFSRSASSGWPLLVPPTSLNGPKVLKPLQQNSPATIADLSAAAAAMDFALPRPA